MNIWLISEPFGFKMWLSIDIYLYRKINPSWNSWSSGIDNEMLSESLLNNGKLQVYKANIQIWKRGKPKIIKFCVLKK